MNLPWLHYGGDFGSNAWRPSGGLARQDLDPLHRTLDAAAHAGAQIVRWFVLCDARAGVEVDGGGVPTALQPVVIDDMRAALDALDAHGLRMVPVLLDFTLGRTRQDVNGVQIGGRAHILSDPCHRHRLLRAIDTLLAAFGHDARIATWDVFNEPEWLAAPWQPPARRVRAHVLRRFLGELVLHVRWHASQPVTVGLASARGLSFCRDLELDFMQVHWYDHLERRCPLDRRPCPRWTQAPIVLGEFPTRGSNVTPEQLLARAAHAGYAGAWAWSLEASDAASDRDAALRALHHHSRS